MKAGIMVDDYKLPIFREKLTRAGFLFVENKGLVFGVTLITVETDDKARLERVVRVANSEAAWVAGRC